MRAEEVIEYRDDSVSAGPSRPFQIAEERVMGSLGELDDVVHVPSGRRK